MYIQDIFNFVYNYLHKGSLHYCSQISSMSYKSTAVDWGNFICDLFIEYVYPKNILNVKFTGIVEIDESLFGRQIKHNRGRPSGHRIWIFGMIDRSTNIIV